MTIRLHIEIIGATLIILGAAHAAFPRYFGWNRELKNLSLLARQVFLVHCFFIAVLLVLLGIASLFYADALLEATPLSRIILTGLVFFWSCRLVIQFAGYNSAIWRGNRFYTTMHVVFSVFWTYVVATYGAALWSQM